MNYLFIVCWYLHPTPLCPPSRVIVIEQRKEISSERCVYLEVGNEKPKNNTQRDLATRLPAAASSRKKYHLAQTRTHSFCLDFIQFSVELGSLLPSL